jgi:hypothetical protein
MEVKSSSGIYTATCDVALVENVQKYINAIDVQFPILVECFGLKPLIKQYRVKIGPKGTWYGGMGKIALLFDDHNLFRDPPECYDGGLVFETIHGFLEPLRHPPYGFAKKRNGENRLGESFSTIIEICFLERIGATNIADRYKKGHGMGPYHYPLLFALVEIYAKYGMEPFQHFFRGLERSGKSSKLMLDVNKYGSEDRTPYGYGYMRRLAELFDKYANINVKHILEAHSAGTEF